MEPRYFVLTLTTEPQKHRLKISAEVTDPDLNEDEKIADAIIAVTFAEEAPHSAGTPFGEIVTRTLAQLESLTGTDPEPRKTDAHPGVKIWAVEEI